MGSVVKCNLHLLQYLLKMNLNTCTLEIFVLVHYIFATLFCVNCFTIFMLLCNAAEYHLQGKSVKSTTAYEPENHTRCFPHYLSFYFSSVVVLGFCVDCEVAEFQVSV